MKHKISMFLVSIGLIVQSVHAYDTEILSLSPASDGSILYSARDPDINSDGRFVAYQGNARLEPNNPSSHFLVIFIYDRHIDVSKPVSVPNTGGLPNGGASNPKISGDGRYVLFDSTASNLVDNDLNNVRDVFVYDAQTERLELISLSSLGEQANADSFAKSISYDGRFISFDSMATNLVSNDINGTSDGFVYDRQTATVIRVGQISTPWQQGVGSISASVISDNGQFVAITTTKRLAYDDKSQVTKDVYVQNLQTNAIELISTSGLESTALSMSADGQLIGIFDVAAGGGISASENPVLSLHDRITGTNEVLSTIGGYGMSISSDGRFVAFISLENDLDENMYDGYAIGRHSNIFVKDRKTGDIKLVSRVKPDGLLFDGTGLPAPIAGTQTTSGNTRSPSISDNGEFIAFESPEKDLVDNHTGNSRDVFVASSRLFHNEDLDVEITPSSRVAVYGANPVDRFTATLKNNGTDMLTNCKALLIDPANEDFTRYDRKFNYFTREIGTFDFNSGVDLAPGESKQVILALSPREFTNQEVEFEFACSNNFSALSIPLVNTIYLRTKPFPLSAQDATQLTNANNKTELIVNLSSGKYWSLYGLDVRNTGDQPSIVNLSIISELSQIKRSALCEVLGNGNWQCLAPRSENLQIELAGGQTKKVLVFVHVTDQIDQDPSENRIFVQALDEFGDIVAKNSIGVYTIN